MESKTTRYVTIENGMGFICEVFYDDYLKKYTVFVGSAEIRTETKPQMNKILKRLGWKIEAKRKGE